MRHWFHLLIRNSFFQVGLGIFLVMILGGLVLRMLEIGKITEGEAPFWWAIVTMTTVGYGDFVPKTPEGRMFAVLVMFAGISLTAMFTAIISSIFVAKRIREEKGLEKVNIKNHIILCGWNRNADKIIHSIQYLAEAPRKNIVLINDLDEEEIERLKTRYRKIRLHFVVGDFTSEQVLEKANLEAAETVIIIPSDINDSIQNPDDKTILAALTIKGLEPNIRLIAYLHDRENLTHIKRANADEVVISDDFGAYLNYRTDVDSLSTRVSPTLFYPLMAKVGDEKQSDKIMEHFYNPDEFYGEWMLPSTTRNDPTFPRQRYWKGAIWPPLNFLTYLSLRQAGYSAAATELSEKSLKLIMTEWTRKGYVSENYSAITGTGDDTRLSSDRFHSWGALFGIMTFIENGFLPKTEKPLD